MKAVYRLVLLMVFAGVSTQEGWCVQKMTFNLKQSIETALEHNSTLAQTKQDVFAARAKLGEARTGFFPKVTGNGNYTKLDVAPFMPGKIFANFSGAPADAFPKRIPIGQDKIYSFGIRIQQPIFTGFKVVNGYKIASEGVKMADAQMQKSEGDVTFQVIESYWNLIKAREFVTVSREAVEQMKSHVKDLENMFSLGMVTKNDLLKARVQLSSMEISSMRAANGEELAEKAFCNVMGIPLDTEVELTEPLETVPDDSISVSVEQSINAAIENRPELKMMLHGIRASKKAVDIAQAGYMPNVALVADYGYKRPDREYANQFYNTWTVSLVASVNIFDWGETYYKKMQAKSNVIKMQENYKQVQNAIKLETTSIVLQLREVEKRISVARDNVSQAKENYKITDNMFRQGMATNSEVLDASTLLTKAKTDYITALADYRITLARYRKAVGVIGKGE
ncbi:TolC family protein [bacterium]|nr:TolC family protein [bacterium]